MASYDNIRLEKGLYTTNKSFTAALEELDPSENYAGTPLEGLDAYQRQLKRFDIRVSGAGSDAVEKFFMTTDSAALFPEYVSRAVRRGIEDADMLADIIAATTNIDSPDYRSVACVPTEDDKELKIVSEGALIPETVIRSQENLIRLNKRGRMVTASYEAIRFKKLDLFTVTLKQIGAYIARSQFKDAVNVLVNGDGNSNPAESVELLDSAMNAFTYSELVNFWNSFDPYELNVLIGDPKSVSALLNLTEFKDAAAGLSFHSTGKMITPLGARLIKSSAVGENTIIGLDKSCALEMVKSGDVSTEFDKLIDRQLERAVISVTAGFAKIYTGASKLLTLE